MRQGRVAVRSSATLRFYAELNDFLPPRLRQSEVGIEFDVGPSVKDAFEGLGVPHTEVDLVLANGEPVGLAYRLADGDRVSVYPAFRRIDLSPLVPLRPGPPHGLRFATDVHLGALTRYLRLLGFDTRSDPGWTDDELVAVSVAEGRVLATRDRDLLKRRAVTHGLFVRDDDPDEQLLEAVRRLRLGGEIRPFTRCMACNGLLEEADKASVAGRIGPGTRAAFDRFRQCRSCGRVYWEGAHRPRLLGLVERARAAGTEASPGR